MTEIRRKKHSFHQSIRNSQRQAFRAKARKDLAVNSTRQKVVSALDAAAGAWFEDWQTERENLWAGWGGTIDTSGNRTSTSSTAFTLITQTCESLMHTISTHEHDSNSRLQTLYYLLQNLPYLIPPPQIPLPSLPSPFLLLCTHLLKSTLLTSQDKEMFVQSLDSHNNTSNHNNRVTIRRCLLGYFAENWEEIRGNRCEDLVVGFFVEYTKRREFNSGEEEDADADEYDENFEKVLGQVVREVLEASGAEMRGYGVGFHQLIQEGSQLLQERSQLLTTASSQINTLSHSHSPYSPSHYHSPYSPYYSPPTSLPSLLRHSTFLCHLLLLHPITNYLIKETRPQLSNIAMYLYKKVLLNEENSKYAKQAEYCVSVLLAYTVDHQRREYVRVVGRVVGGAVGRERGKRERWGKKEMERGWISKQTEIDQYVQRKSNKEKENQQECDSAAMMTGDDCEMLLNRTCLLMLSTVSQHLHQLKLSRIEQWLSFHLSPNSLNRNSTTIFSLQTSGPIRCLLTTLTQVLRNESSHSSSSPYSHPSTYQSSYHQHLLLAKIKIIKMVKKKGWDGLIASSSLREYQREMAGLLVELVKGLEEMGEVEGFVVGLGLGWNREREDEGCYDDRGQMGDEDEEEDSLWESYYEQEQWQQHSSSINPLLTSIKTYIYTLTTRFLQKSYKHLPYQHKQKLLLHLISNDYFGEEECKGYLTLQEAERFGRGFRVSWEEGMEGEEDDGKYNEEEGYNEEEVDDGKLKGGYEDEYGENDTDTFQQSDRRDYNGGYLKHQTNNQSNNNTNTNIINNNNNNNQQHTDYNYLQYNTPNYPTTTSYPLNKFNATTTSLLTFRRSPSLSSNNNNPSHSYSHSYYPQYQKHQSDHYNRFNQDYDYSYYNNNNNYAHNNYAHNTNNNRQQQVEFEI